MQRQSLTATRPYINYKVNNMGRPKGSKNKPKEIETKPEIPEGGELGEPAHKDRLAIIDEIAEMNREEDVETAEIVAQEETQETPETIETEEETPEETPEEAPAEETPEEPEIEAKKKYIIDGVEKEFTDEEITVIVQKHGTADQRLAEATQLLKDAKATQETFVPPTQPPAPPSSVADVVDEKELVKDVTQAIVYGDEEQIAKAFETLLGQGRAPDATPPQGMSEEQVQGYVTEMLAFEKGKRLLETPADNGGFADLWSDPMLRRMFQKREAELRDERDNRPYDELYTAIGTEIRSWRDDLLKQNTPKTGLEDREAAKRSTGVVRGAGGKPPVTPEAKPQTHEEVLNDLRVGRGLT